MVIDEANPPFEIRRIVLPPERQFVQVGQAATQSLNLPLVPSIQERSMVEKIDTKPAAATPKKN